MNHRNKPRGKGAPDLVFALPSDQYMKAAKDYGCVKTFETFDYQILENADAICDRLEKLLEKTPQDVFEERMSAVSEKYKRGEISIDEAWLEYGQIVHHRISPC